MKFCFQKQQITPYHPVFLSGFGDRTHDSEGILDDIYASAVVIQANKAILFLALDFTSGDKPFVEEIKSRLCSKFRLEPKDILINFSHSHSSIMARCANPSNGNTPVEKYYETLGDKIEMLVAKCFDNLEEGEMQFARGYTNFNVSRRLIADGIVKWAPNYEANIDKGLDVFKFTNSQGMLKGILFSLGCHPSSLGPSNYLLSADYPGYTCKYIQEVYTACEAVFLQGCGGELKPVASTSETQSSFKDCTPEETREAGISLGKQVVDIVEKGSFKTINTDIATYEEKFELYTDILDTGYFEGLLQRAVQPKNFDAMTKRINRIIDSIKSGAPNSSIPYSVTFVKLDDTTAVIGLEGEVLSPIGMKIKELLKSTPFKDTTVLGYTNGIPLYISTAQVYREGGYERDVFVYRGLSGPLLPETEDKIYDCVTSIVREKKYEK